MSQLSIGLHCKACDAPLNEKDDAELCYDCMKVVYMYNKHLIEDEEDVEFDILLETQEEDWL